jgi:hypothetical protein
VEIKTTALERHQRSRGKTCPETRHTLRSWHTIQPAIKPTGSSLSTRRADIGKEGSVKDLPAQASDLLRMVFKGPIVLASLDTVALALSQENANA